MHEVNLVTDQRNLVVASYTVVVIDRAAQCARARRLDHSSMMPKRIITTCATSGSISTSRTAMADASPSRHLSGRSYRPPLDCFLE